MTYRSRSYSHYVLKIGLICSFIMSPIILSGCSDYNDQAELTEWMAQQRKNTPTTIQPVYPPIPFVAVPYLGAVGIDPFDDQKIKNALRLLNSSDSALKPDLSRKREILESYPLDTIKMLGFFMRQGKATGIISASGTLFNVNVGNYIGQDFGKITSITEQGIALKEVVQDGSGAWVERVATLSLVVAGKDASAKGK
jgi:type IV pilus assembly protein PilP